MKTFLALNLNEPDSYFEVYRCKCGSDLIDRDGLERHKAMFGLQSMIIMCSSCDETKEVF